MLSNRTRIPSLDDHYCQLCSTSASSKDKRLSCFSCDHCRQSMCYECFEKHTNELIDEYTQTQTRFSQFTHAMEQKREFLTSFQEHCLQNVNTTFDEIISDLETLRKESLTYVRQQFQDAQIFVNNLGKTIQPMMMKSQQQWAQNGISKSSMDELEKYKKQITEMETRLEVFSSPTMRMKMPTYPRQKLDLYCQVLTNAYSPAKKCSYSYQGKAISARCCYRKANEPKHTKIDVETEVEEFQQNHWISREVQTMPPEDEDSDGDDMIDDLTLDPSIQINNRINRENCLSTRFSAQGTILAQNEVDRIASDGENLLYFSETSKSLCYILNFSSSQRGNGVSITQEITCRWPHYSILDMIYSPSSSQFVFATKSGVYSCSINTQQSKIDFQLQLTQSSSYVRLAADKNYIWLWTDTPRANLLRTYSPRTFTCVKIFNLNDYSRFLDNSTSFCVHSNILATLFQFRPPSTTNQTQKIFHLTLADNIDLHELCTIRLGPCDIDHEIRVGPDGLFFITNGKRRLWVVDRLGKKEYVKLLCPGRALTVHRENQIIIANGTQQLQCVQLLKDKNYI